MQTAGGRFQMDRAGNVDSVDGAEVSLEDAGSGWDAYAVWRERVHGARTQTASARTGAKLRDAAQESTSTGWDPLETWQGRVQRARANRRA